MVNVELPGEAGGGVAVLDAKFAARPVAIGVDRCFGHAQLAGDLFGRKMLVDKPQAFTLARGKQPDRIFGNDVSCDHSDAS
jgi:hypothetical protein